MGPKQGQLFESVWDEVGGLKIHARVSAAAPSGGGACTPVVLVHGLGVSGRYFIPTIGALAPRVRVYAPDLPGFGLSDRPARTLDVAGLSSALADWMSAAGLARASLLGHSLGAQVVADFARRRPARVDRAVLAGPTGDTRARTVWPNFVRLLLDAPREPLSLMPVLARDYFAAGLRAIVYTFRQSLRDPFAENLPHVTVPTLVVCGERDPVAPPRWGAEAARLLPRGRLAVIPCAGHAFNYSAPGELARACLPFLCGAD